MQNKIIKFFLFIAFAVMLMAVSNIAAIGQENNNPSDSTNLSEFLIHFHPASTIFSLSTLFSELDAEVLLYLTLEKQMSKLTSLIIRPSFILSNSFFGKDSITRIGTDIGVRYYISEKSGFGDGFYLGGSAGLFLFRYKEHIG